MERTPKGAGRYFLADLEVLRTPHALRLRSQEPPEMESVNRGGSRPAIASNASRYTEILGGRSGGVGDDASHVSLGKRRKVFEDVFNGVALCQTDQDSTECHASACDDGFSSADFWVAHDMCFEVHSVVFCPARAAPGHRPGYGRRSRTLGRNLWPQPWRRRSIFAGLRKLIKPQITAGNWPVLQVIAAEGWDYTPRRTCSAKALAASRFGLNLSTGPGSCQIPVIKNWST